MNPLDYLCLQLRADKTVTRKPIATEFTEKRIKNSALSASLRQSLSTSLLHRHSINHRDLFLANSKPGKSDENDGKHHRQRHK